MPTWVALLRAVNVGTGRSLPMADLRRIVEGEGFAEVRTYIQSGNVLFASPARSGAGIGKKLRAAIAAETGLDVPVIVRSAAELAAALERCPFPEEHAHVLFLEAPPAPPFDAESFAPERYAASGGEVYLELPGGAGRSKLAAKVARTKALAGTARNLRTVRKLVELAASG